MIVYREREIPRASNSVVTVGVFDGVHRAHQKILEQVTERARNRQGRSVVITFDPHPKEVLANRRGHFSVLLTLEERLAWLEQLHVDVVWLIHFTYEFSRQSAREFYQKYIIEAVGLTEVVVGYDHMFGRDREGSIDVLRSMGEQYGFEVVTVGPIDVGGETVSSSKIRRGLSEGRVEEAARLLGRPYEVVGRVEKGSSRGMELSFPTANIRPASPKKLIPKNGVYFVQVEVQGKEYFGMMNIGVRPTFESDGRRVLEVHLFDFKGQIYGLELETKFLGWIREEKTFSSGEELVSQLHADRAECLKRKETNLIKA